MPRKTDTSDAAPAPRALTAADAAAGGIAFSIATLVTDPSQYARMQETFRAAGFGAADCEYLFIDNTAPEQTDAFAGLNRALGAARGRYVILCHQDVRLIGGGDDRAVLERRLAELDRRDSAWALAGNAGGAAPGRLALRISDPHGRDRTEGDLPERVMSLDENFIVVRRAANLGFSRDLSGFHLYGADICTVADLLGWSAYVIDFHLEHLSAGNAGAAFQAGKASFREKWARALRPRWIQTTCTLLFIDGHPLQRFIASFAETPIARLSRRWPGARGWGRHDDRPAA